MTGADVFAPGVKGLDGGISVGKARSRILYPRPCMTEIYLHFRCAHEVHANSSTYDLTMTRVRVSFCLRVSSSGETVACYVDIDNSTLRGQPGPFFGAGGGSTGAVPYNP